MSSISNNFLSYNDEDQVISSDNEDNVDKINGKPKTNKTPSAQFCIPRKSAKMNFNNVPIVIFNKWVIGIEQNEFKDKLRACVNSFQSSPKHMVKLMTTALGQVTFDTQHFMTFKVMGVVFVNGDGP